MITISHHAMVVPTQQTILDVYCDVTLFSLIVWTWLLLKVSEAHESIPEDKNCQECRVLPWYNLDPVCISNLK